MENTIDAIKSATLSFKTTPQVKTELQQIANEKNITRSELIASLIHHYKHNYDFIGKSSPKEEQLKLKLSKVEREKRKLSLALENADNRIEIEQKNNRKYAKEQLEMDKVLFNLQEELKTTRSEISRLTETLNTNHPVTQDHHDTKLLYGSLGSLLLSGLTLLLMPKLFNN